MTRVSLIALGVGAIILATVTFLMLPREKPMAPFECPETHQKTTTTALKETEADKKAATAALMGPELENAILVLTRDLRTRYPNADTVEIVNYLVTAYCPIVAKDTALTNDQKRARIDRFSSQVLQILKSQ